MCAGDGVNAPRLRCTARIISDSSGATLCTSSMLFANEGERAWKACGRQVRTGDEGGLKKWGFRMDRNSSIASEGRGDLRGGIRKVDVATVAQDVPRRPGRSTIR